jgi:ribosomal protein L33
MSQDKLQKMRAPSGHTIFTRKNKKGVERKLELKKFDPTIRARVVYKEVKK